MLRPTLYVSLVIASFIANAAIAKPYLTTVKKTVSGCLSTGHKTALNSIFVAAACDDLKTVLQLPEGYCSSTHLLEASVFYGDVDNECSSGSRYQITGQFVADASWQ